MRKLFATVVWLISFSAYGQTTTPISPSILIPSPAGLVITVGTWLVDVATRDPVYYIEVLGEGRTAEEAKNNGFRIAVEQAVGSIIASETEVNASRITRDEIISYASGYVTKYEIVKQQPSGIGVKTTMKVWVKRSTIANRLLHSGNKPSEIDGPTAATNLATLQHERRQGDRLVNTVVNDFYRLGMVVQAKAPSVMFDNNRNGILTIPFLLTWNDAYVESLYQALKATAQDNQTENFYVSIPSGFFSNKLGFSDSYKIDKILNTMVGTKPTIKITIYTNENRLFYMGCYKLDELDHSSGFDVQGATYFVDSKFYGPRNVVINRNFKVEKTMAIPMSPQQLQQANRIELKVIPAYQCPR